MDGGKERAIALLREFRATATPKFVDSGDALTYLAYKDEVLEKVVNLLSSAFIEPIPNCMQRLHVNHEQLAKTVIERTFDAHTQVLRSKLAEAEKAADMWKKAALFGAAADGSSENHTAPAQLVFCIPERLSAGSQTRSVAEEAAASESSTNVQPCYLICEEVKEWLAGWVAKILDMVAEKLELWCSFQPCLAAPAGVGQQEHEGEHPRFDDCMKASASRNSMHHAFRKMNSAMVDGKMSRKEGGKATEEAGPAPPSLVSSETPVQITSSHSYATTSIVSIPRLSNADAHLSLYAPPGSPLYVLRPINLKARPRQSRGKQLASTSGAQKRWMPKLPQM
ncbi:hypothetical protein LSCM1_07452 [Leishmania martiniquensis]|uniref:Uncharacterized protein n=1 Tax=Leishmania martiniquensis TaxID=1580590 RepID=A0A836GSS1_9TRYP|nr:hypothetical protein LSCM1_07452 [Leishmania martiniquensis]